MRRSWCGADLLTWVWVLALALGIAAPMTSSVAQQGVQHGARFAAGTLTFAIEGEGASLIGVSGTGTSDDPIVIIERVTSLAASRLVMIRRDIVPTGPPLPSLGNSLRIAMTKIVINATNQPWSGYDLELEEISGRPSTYRDGLSFDQTRTFANVRLGSDRFDDMHWSPEPYDRLRFRRGAVNVGERVALAFAVTDVSPVRRFYLRQQPILVAASLPSPGRRIAFLHPTAMPQPSGWRPARGPGLSRP